MTKVIQAHNSGILSLTATSPKPHLFTSPLLFHSLPTPWLYHPSLPISPHRISDSPLSSCSETSLFSPRSHGLCTWGRCASMCL